MSSKVLVIDNGGDTMKVGWAEVDNHGEVIPNCIVKPKSAKRSYIATEISQLKDMSSLFYRRPIEKGYVVNWDVEGDIWERVLGKNGMKVDYSNTSLILTEAHFSSDFVHVFERTNEMIFEKFNFADSYRTAPSSLALREHFNTERSASGASVKCGVVLDSGYSFTHAVPYYDGNKINYAIRRLDLGGKALTNYLKEMISYRAWNMMNETHLMNHIKERLSLCSLDFNADLGSARLKPFDPANKLVRHFVLPDYSANLHGFVIDHDTPPPGAKVPNVATMKRGENAPPGEQVLNMAGERVSVPEALFRPSDLGLNQCGVAELIVEAVSASPPDFQELLYGNIVLTGGNTKIPQFKERLLQELRPLVPQEYAINVTLADEPDKQAFRGGQALGQSTEFAKMTVTKKDYLEHGHNICYARYTN